MTEQKIINAIMYHVGCDKETAKMIFNGVWGFNGDKYSAFKEEERLVICKNGFPIHRLNIM